MESRYIHKRHNVSVLMYHLVCAAKYRRVVMSRQVDEVLRTVCLEIQEALGDCVFGDWVGSGSRALSDPVGAELQSDADCDDGEEPDRAGGVCPGAGSESQ